MELGSSPPLSCILSPLRQNGLQMNGRGQKQPRADLAADGGDRFLSKLRKWRWDGKLASRQRQRSHDGFCELFMFWNERGRTRVGGRAGPHPSSVFYVHIKREKRE